MRSEEEGSATAQLLMILFFGAAALAGIALFASASLSYERRSIRKDERRRELVELLSPMLGALSDDATPESDWIGDSVWLLIRGSAPGAVYTLRDVSSAVNLNFIDAGLFETTDLRTMLLPGSDPARLRAHRSDRGPSVLLEEYASFFTSESMQYATTYGWANINIIDPGVLHPLLRVLTGSESDARTYDERIRAYRDTGYRITSEELPRLFGSGAGDVSPVLNAEAVMNVHFASPFVLEAVASAPEFGIEEPADKVRALLVDRDRRELSSADIRTILGVASDHTILNYFGTRTWFWELSVRKDGEGCSVILARLPSAPEAGGSGDERARFLIVERRWD